MPAPHPRMHGITHVPGGPDPVPGLLPPLGDTLDSKILAAADMFWKLDELSGVIAHDSTGNGHDLHSPTTPPLWGQPAGPPGTTTAKWIDNNTSMRAPVGSTIATFTDNFTAGVWVNILVASSPAEIIGQGTSYHGVGAPGWNIMMLPAGLNYKFAVLVNGNPLYANNDLDPNRWYFVAVVRDTGIWKLYVDGLLQTATISDSPGATSYGSNTWLGNDGYISHTTYLRDALLSYAFIAGRVMSGTELQGLVDAAALAGPTTSGGLVLGTGPDGEPAWVEPPAPHVTVNGSTSPASTTNNPAPPAPPTPPPPTDLTWIQDQPFTYNGSTFTVQPRKWTTIPFTTPLMERQSNKTGATAWVELALTDPAMGGWLDPKTPHTILIAHDIPFLIPEQFNVTACLKVETPPVQGSSSNRVIRIFETTHQKTLVTQTTDLQRDLWEQTDGLIGILRDPSKPGISTHGTFAWNSDEFTTSPAGVGFNPNAQGGFTMNGEDWLPRNASGQPTLKKGMRLVAQVWHDADTTQTFSTSSSTSDVYKPYLGIYAWIDDPASWGPPWSTW